MRVSLKNKTSPPPPTKNANLAIISTYLRVDFLHPFNYKVVSLDDKTLFQKDLWSVGPAALPSPTPLQNRRQDRTGQ